MHVKTRFAGLADGQHPWLQSLVNEKTFTLSNLTIMLRKLFSKIRKTIGAEPKPEKSKPAPAPVAAGAAVPAAAGGSIVDAKVFTTSDGFALDLFSVQDAEGGPFGDASRAERLKQTILKIVRGEAVPRALFAKRPPKSRASAFNVPSRITFDNEASHTATVVEVRGRDRVGFLYDVSTALFESGLTISSAMIATYGERVVDVFYVTDRQNCKIRDEGRLDEIRRRLAEVIQSAGKD